MNFNTGVATCNFSLVKDKFFKFAHYASLYNNYKNKIDNVNIEQLTEKEKNELIKLEEEIGHTYLGIFQQVIPTIYKRDHLNELLPLCNFDVKAQYGSLFCIDALRWLDNYKKVDVRRIVNNHIKSSSINYIYYPETAKEVKDKINLIIDEFYRTEFNTFKDFFLYYENLFLSSIKAEFMSNNSDEVGSFIAKLETSLAFQYAGFNSSMTFIKDSAFSYENDVEEFWNREDYRFIFILHYMRQIASIKDIKSISKNDIANAWIETPVFDAMILYFCNIIEDILVDTPNFIHNIDYVGANRANVQRLYNFQDQTDFNQLLQKYLTQQQIIPNRELFEVFNPAILSTQTIKVVKVLPDGQPIFEHPVKQGVQKYSLHSDYDYSDRYKAGEFTKKWLHNFEIADDISFEMTAEGAGVSVILIKDNERRNLADYGFGITQLVSIMLQIELNIFNNQKENGTEIIEQNNDEVMQTIIKELAEKEIEKNTDLGKKVAPYIKDNVQITGDLLIELMEMNKDVQIPEISQIHKVKYVFDESYLAIEEPESHLHPKFQSLLADMFYDAYINYNIHFIIETHSEYLVRRTQVVVAEAKYKDEQELTDKCPFKVYYLPDPKKDVKPYDLEYMTTGGFKNSFGEGFFDEASKLDMVILRNERNLRRR